MLRRSFRSTLGLWMASGVWAALVGLAAAGCRGPDASPSREGKPTSVAAPATTPAAAVAPSPARPDLAATAAATGAPPPPPLADFRPYLPGPPLPAPPCPTLRQTADRLLPATLRKSGETHLVSGGCVSIGANRLGLVVRSVKLDARKEAEDLVLFRASLGLAWLGPEGKGPPRPLKLPAELQSALEEVMGLPGDGLRKWVRLGAATDFDGDGATELVIVLGSGGHEALTTLAIQLWTLRGDVLTRYAHDPKLPDFETPEFDEVARTEQRVLRDVDGDGRPELIHIGPYRGKEVSNLGLFDALPVPALFAYHADARGMFSASDGVAQQHIRRFCGDGAAQLKTHAPSEDEANHLVERLTRYVICARVQGQPAQALLARLQPQCPAWNATDFQRDTATAEELKEAKKRPQPDACPPWLTDLVNVTPPLTVPPTPGKSP